MHEDPVKADTNEGRVSRRSDMILAVPTLVVFSIIAVVSTLERALAFALAVAVFISIIQTKKESWRDRRFWIVLTVFALAHLVILSLIRIPELRYGMMAMPFALADGFAMWGIINWLERRSPATSEPACEKRGDGPS
jgi:hypothetical protein